MRTITKIIIHAADTTPTMDIGVEEIRQWHTDPPPKGNGWSDIGYNYVIRRDGTLEGGRDLDGDGDFEDEVGAHAYGHNSTSLGVCLVGGRSATGGPEANFTFWQYSALWALFQELEIKYPGVEILGHKDLKGVMKPCPCFDVKSFLCPV